ncbi:MAG: hypothetical protein OEZ58_14150 [Gammaproteobacteria bacterium]|nr:hypothetical protein [Gammaproteobacteria bacterium]MDH5730133.1 hypothetical protein [Gammaproteobacteria bacterium]
MLFDSGIIDLTQKISEARATSIAVFDYSTATTALEKLKEVKLTESETRRYIRDNYSPEDEGLGINAIFAALEVLNNWLKTVSSSEVGLFIVG